MRMSFNPSRLSPLSYPAHPAVRYGETRIVLDTDKTPLLDTASLKRFYQSGQEQAPVVVRHNGLGTQADAEDVVTQEGGMVKILFPETTFQFDEPLATKQKDGTWNASMTGTISKVAQET